MVPCHINSVCVHNHIVYMCVQVWKKETFLYFQSKQLLNANLEFYKNKLRSKPGGKGSLFLLLRETTSSSMAASPFKCNTC